MTIAENNILKIISCFEGARLGSAVVDGNTISIKLLYDEPVVADWKRHDYRLHFTFGIENTGKIDQDVRVRVSAGNRDELAYPSPLLYLSNMPQEGYQKVDVVGASDEFNKYDFDIKIPAMKTVFIANCLPRMLPVLEPLLEGIGKETNAQRIVFGQSIEGRELVAYQYMRDGENRPLVLVTSGIHPPEPDTLATQALMEFLGKEESRYLRDVFDFVIIPVMNPDGYAHGSQAGNAAGINFYWDFRYRDEARCPEAKALYDFAMVLKPVLYFDFHAYTFQSRKHASPYCKPVRRYRGEKVRQAISKSYDRVKSDVSSGKAVYGFGTYAPSTFGEILTRKLNTIGYAKYHIHLQDGVDESKNHAVAAVRTVCGVLLEQKLTRPQDILKFPYGEVPGESLQEWIRKLDVVWSGYLLPLLYGYYCRHFRKLFKRS